MVLPVEVRLAPLKVGHRNTLQVGEQPGDDGEDTDIVDDSDDGDDADDADD